jgi:oxygen-independent coproporphyrinogen-3 oxidase
MNSPSPSTRSNLPVGEKQETTVGNYFVANYPPFSFWSEEHVPAVKELLASPPSEVRPIGLYVHIPFCRKRCDFCYFRVYTGGDARSSDRYVAAVLAEQQRYAALPQIKDRHPRFVYFGGGTPSFLDVAQLRRLFGGLQAAVPWTGTEEVTFECEPGTLDAEKIEVLRDLGVTRLSLGVENFNPDILALNNRAHRAVEIGEAYEKARAVGFPQINLDLIAGMVGETDENWVDTIRQTVDLAPESVTIYQMEVPYNTTIYQQMKDGESRVAPVADWITKRRWVDEAFRALEAAGYTVGSAYTAKKDDGVRFLYRDGLWHGADMLGLGVSSFSHLGGIHFQNEHHLEPYCEAVEAGRLPLHRALPLTEDEKLIREFILQMKLGVVETAHLKNRYGVDPTVRFREPLAAHERDGWLTVGADRITLTRQGLLRVDLLLPAFFQEEHQDARYA